MLGALENAPSSLAYRAPPKYDLSIYWLNCKRLTHISTAPGRPFHRQDNAMYE